MHLKLLLYYLRHSLYPYHHTTMISRAVTSAIGHQKRRRLEDLTKVGLSTIMWVGAFIIYLIEGNATIREDVRTKNNQQKTGCSYPGFSSLLSAVTFRQVTDQLKTLLSNSLFLSESLHFKSIK